MRHSQQQPHGEDIVIEQTGTKDDVVMIEGDTGKKVKELSEEELVSAMKRLGIRKLEISSDEKTVIERN